MSVVVEQDVIKVLGNLFCFNFEVYAQGRKSIRSYFR